MITRLSIDGYGARRASSFAGRITVIPERGARCFAWNWEFYDFYY
jgi:hypothetical protein